MFCWAWAQVKLGSAFSSYHPLHVQVAYDQMTGGSEDELWEGENLVYRCKNDTLVLNNDPDMVKVQCNNNIRMTVTPLYSTLPYILKCHTGWACHFDIHAFHTIHQFHNHGEGPY